MIVTNKRPPLSSGFLDKAEFAVVAVTLERKYPEFEIDPPFDQVCAHTLGRISLTSSLASHHSISHFYCTA